MANEPESVKKKIIFTTARRKAADVSTIEPAEVCKKVEALNLKDETLQEPSSKPVKPKKTRKEKKEKPVSKAKQEEQVPDSTTTVPNSTADAAKVDPVKKKSSRRRKTKKSEAGETEGISQNTKAPKTVIVSKPLATSAISPSLSAEAVPFVPGSQAQAQEQVQPKPKIAKERKPVSRPKPTESDLRSVEVKQLQIRFSPTGFSQKKSADDSLTLQCVMPITDPDFAFDLESIRLEIVLPKGYPGNKSTPIRPLFTILNSNLPCAIISRIERNLKWGMNSLEGGILVCRPMLRYLEDNLEKWIVDDVKESAFKFVKPAEIKVTEKSEGELESESNNSESDESESDSTEFLLPSPKQQQQSSTASRVSVGDWIAPPPISDQSSVGGQAYTLKLIFSTIHGIDLLTSQRITFLASCDRCKFNFPVEDLRPFVDRIEHCPKCTNQTKFYYKSQLITPGANFDDGDDQFESVLGTIRFLRARPVDLLPSLYQCACSRCYGTEDSSVDNNSSCKIEKVKIGENISYSCFNCHQKIRFQLDRTEWISDLIGETKKSATQKSQAKGPTLTVGNPLPLNGACEHYKKSFRWYRFPCCGQAFPCDECHAKDPIAKAHPVEWATRFICGFCSREQFISVKECPECGKDTSAAGRKHTAFWEGGKGIRNQILMSRKDSKKYKDYSLNSKSKKKT